MAVEPGYAAADEQVESASPPVQPSPSTPPPFRITTARRADRPIKAMFYGTPGSGKTTLAATAADVPSMRDVLFIDAEAGSLSIQHREEIDIISVGTFYQFARVHDYLQRHCSLRDAGDIERLRKLEEGLRGESIRTPRQYRTVVIDSLTEVQRYFMNQLTGVIIGATALDAELQTPQGSDWQKQAEAIKHLVRTFRDLPMNVIFVCGEQVTLDEAQRHHKRPNLPGKLPLEVMGFLDLVGYLATGVVDGAQQRRLYLQSGNTFVAKSRFRSIEQPYIEQPTLAELLRLASAGASTNGMSS